LIIGWTALHWASFGGQRDCVKYLIEKGANVSPEGVLGYIK
jgi:ankyrin repeat protein